MIYIYIHIYYRHIIITIIIIIVITTIRNIITALSCACEYRRLCKTEGEISHARNQHIRNHC